MEPSSVFEACDQVFEACDCLKLLSIHLDLCVDATGVVCHQLGFLGTDLHAVGCGGFVKTLLNLPVLLLLPLPLRRLL